MLNMQARAAHDLADFNHLPKHVGDSFYKLKSVKSKLRKMSSCNGFIKKTLHNDIAPIFEKLEG